MLNSNYFSSNFKLAIIGGGQLGKMLLTETLKMDIYTMVLDISKDAPSRLACNEFVVGDLMDYDTVYRFGTKADLITIEIEHINVDALEKLEQEGKIVHPKPAVLRNIQDKGLQKLLYREKGIYSAPFTIYDSKEQYINDIKCETSTLPAVWKSRKFGYDGKGVAILRTIADVESLPNVPFIVEEMVDFEKELAVLVARNNAGEMSHYPVVEMEFNDTANLVEFVICPANIPDYICKKAIEIALHTAQSLEVTGVLAVELFLAKTGEILVNEVAPRPHNSGHFTIEAAYTSQFEQHLRAILNLPLGDTTLKSTAVMYNLIGQPGFTGPVWYENAGSVLALPGASLHIYGKTSTKPYRKMGHVTVTNAKLSVAKEIALEVKSLIKVKSTNK